MKEKLYEEVGANYRFFARWRHVTVVGNLVVIWGTLSLCISAYKEAPQLMWVIPLFASPFGIILWIIDVRTRDMYHAALRAGKDLEEGRNGFYTRIMQDVALAKGISPAKKLTQSLALNILFFWTSAFFIALTIWCFINFG